MKDNKKDNNVFKRKKQERQQYSQERGKTTHSQQEGKTQVTTNTKGRPK